MPEGTTGLRVLTIDCPALNQDCCRLNAVWALKNLIYQAELDVKSAVMDQLSFPRLQALMTDSELSVQEQALAVLRNLASGQASHVEKLVQWATQEQLLAVLKDQLSSETGEVVKQALYTVCNIATGAEVHKAMLMEPSGAAAKIVQHISHSWAEVRLAAVWCIINLTWPQDPGAEARVRALQALGCAEKLVSLVGDTEMNVEDRVQVALSQFRHVTSSSAELRQWLASTNSILDTDLSPTSSEAGEPSPIGPAEQPSSEALGNGADVAQIESGLNPIQFSLSRNLSRNLD